jgi:hypothetical protein
MHRSQSAKSTLSPTHFILWAMALFALASILGCGSGAREPAEPVSEWSLVVGDREAERVTLPAHFAVGPETARYALLSRVTLPAAMRGEAISFVVPWFAARVTLLVDGHEVPSTTARVYETYRGGAQHWLVPRELTAKDAVDIEMRVEHTWTQSAWLDTVPRISRTMHGDARFVALRTFGDLASAFAVVTLLLVSFTYALLYFGAGAARRHPDNAWFSLEAIAGAMFPAFYTGLTQPLFGRWDVAVGATTLCLSALANVHFIHAKFRLKPVHRAWSVAFVAMVALAVVRGDPFSASRWLVPPTAAFLVVNGIYNLVLLRRLAGRSESPANLYVILLAWPCAVAISAGDIVAWVGLGEPLGGLRLGGFATASIAVLQSTALSREHVLSLARTDHLNTELEGRVVLLESTNREVAILNDELRRQVSSRSEELAALLSRLDRAPRHAKEYLAGDVVNERYRIVSPLGAGAAGRVYRVERLTDGRALALKALTSIDDRAAIVRFAREAHVASQVRHANVVSMVDVDVDQTGTLFLVMELVLGPSLHKARARFGEVDWALGILAQLAEGLAAIHESGIVHRDLKPANVLLQEREGSAIPIVKIADFGIAGLAADVEPALSEAAAAPAHDPDAPTLASVIPTPPAARSSSLTGVGLLLGTPLYMAPELLRGAKNAAPASDVFGFGVIAYEILTRKRPYGDLPACVAMAGSTPPPAPLRSRVPVLSEAVADVLDRCTSLSPAARPTAAQIAAVLAALP